MNTVIGSQRLGFRIHEFIELYDRRPVVLDNSIPLSIQANCPADGTPLKIFATLVAVPEKSGLGTACRGGARIGVGCCPSCGYVGYRERPTPEWMERFYLESWDRPETKDIEEEVKKTASRPTIEGGNLWKLLERYHPDTQRFALEIGCGYGRLLKNLERFGFKQLIGVEHSPHRAEVAQRAHEIEVIPGAFESEATQGTLKERAPFSLIFSRHVLEHVYHPARMIELCSSLQQQGDYLVLALPNLEAEVSMSVLLYLPHLHSFGPFSLARLLGRAGYRIINDSSTTPHELFVVAEKEKQNPSTRPFSAASGRYCEETLAKFSNRLGLACYYPTRQRIMWWFRKADVGGQVPLWGGKPLLPLQWAAMVKWYRRKYRKELIAELGLKKYQKKKRADLALLGARVEGLSGRFTRPEESPIEIQFEGPVQLLYK
jgi:SAM-dependent methyltransferase